MSPCGAPVCWCASWWQGMQSADMLLWPLQLLAQTCWCILGPAHLDGLQQDHPLPAAALPAALLRVHGHYHCCHGAVLPARRRAGPAPGRAVAPGDSSSHPAPAGFHRAPQHKSASLKRTSLLHPWTAAPPLQELLAVPRHILWACDPGSPGAPVGTSPLEHRQPSTHAAASPPAAQRPGPAARSTAAPVARLRPPCSCVPCWAGRVAACAASALRTLQCLEAGLRVGSAEDNGELDPAEDVGDMMVRLHGPHTHAQASHARTHARTHARAASSQR